MKYDHEAYDLIMKLMEYAEKQLEAHDKGVMLFEVRGLHEQAMTTFSLHKDQVAEFLHYFIGEDCLNVLPGLDRLNEAEVEATIAASQGSSLKASSTQAGKKAVKEAQKRLDERKRMAPVAEAQEKKKQAEELRAEKERVAKQVQAERDRPKRELDEARKAEKAAEAAVKEAEEAVKKGPEK